MKTKDRESIVFIAQNLIVQAGQERERAKDFKANGHTADSKISLKSAKLLEMAAAVLLDQCCN